MAHIHDDNCCPHCSQLLGAEEALRRAEAIQKAYRELPEEFHRGMLELLVKDAFEVGSISHGRAAELLQCCVQDIRERGWIQGKWEDQVDALTRKLQWVHRNLDRVNDWEIPGPARDVVRVVRESIASVVDVEDDGVKVSEVSRDTSGSDRARALEG